MTSLMASTLLVATIVAIGLAVIAIRVRTVPGWHWLALSTAALAVWSGLAIVEVLATDPVTKDLAARLEFIGAGLVPTGFLLLVGVYTRTRWLLARSAATALVGTGLLVGLLALTNPLHHLVYDGMTPASPTGRGFEVPDSQPLFYVLAGLLNAVALVGLVLVVATLLGSRVAYRRPFRLLAVGAALPLASALLVVFNYAGVGTVVVCVAFALAFSSIAWVMYRMPVSDASHGLMRAARNTIVEVMAEGVVAVSASGVIVEVNPAAATLLGIRANEALGRPAVAVLPGWAALLEDDAVGEVRLAFLPTGRVLDVIRSPLPGGDRLLVMRDATDRAADEERLAYLALHDGLTGLANHGSATAAVARATATAPFGALLLLDLDGFKAVNDRYGHAVGDAVLFEAAGRIRAVASPSAMVARLGGDEFAVLLEGTETGDALRVAESIASALSAPIAAGGPVVVLGASVGVSVWPDDGTDGTTLLRCADVAMYNAKRRRGRVARYDLAEDPRTPERLELLAALPGAIARGELVLHYQPIVAAAGGWSIGVEALVRWEHPRLGLLAPSVFLPLIDEAGLTGDLTLWVAREALEAWARHPPLRRGPQVGINVSPVGFSDPAVARELVRLLDQVSLPASSLVVEITEHAFLSSAPGAAEALAAIRGRGIRLALDDFGTGYAPLSLLRERPDAVKIDGSFLARLGTDTVDTAIVTGVVAMCRDLDIRVVAEGIETPLIAERAAALGVDFLQGYGICRPVPFTELVAWHAGRGDVRAA
jgi:diguanylate cyclase (GGDEF)-like protein